MLLEPRNDLSSFICVRCPWSDRRKNPNSRVTFCYVLLHLYSNYHFFNSKKTKLKLFEKCWCNRPSIFKGIETEKHSNTHRNIILKKLRRHLEKMLLFSVCQKKESFKVFQCQNNLTLRKQSLSHSYHLFYLIFVFLK